MFVKLAYKFLALLLPLVLLCGCGNAGEEAVAVTGVRLDGSACTLAAGATHRLTATVLPETAGNKTVTWSSGNEAVATVDGGLVTAVAVGEAAITVTTDDGDFTATCTVTVEEAVAVTGVRISQAEASLKEGETLQLTATALPETATNKTVTWSSDDEATATVDDTGLVTAVAAGDTVITATTEDGGKEASCSVKVTAAGSENPVTGVTLDQAHLDIMLGKTATLKATVIPSDADNRKVTWTTSDPEVATVAGGVVTAVSNGGATITVTTEEGGLTAECTVTVNWLGKVSFRSTQTWPVGSQVWSDVVKADRCRKMDFDGGTWNAYVADCRQNSSYGDMFSWVAVSTYKDELCTDGWRVPEKEDFRVLDMALGGTGENNQTDDALRNAYINTWGAEYSGRAFKGTVSYLSEHVGYWSQTPYDMGGGDYSNMLFFRTTGPIYPQYHDENNYGYAVRCVK